MSKAKWQHLVRNIPNTEKNRKFIRQINKISKESESIYKLFIKYRKPKEGFQYGSGGAVEQQCSRTGVTRSDNSEKAIALASMSDKLFAFIGFIEQKKELEDENKSLRKQLDNRSFFMPSIKRRKRKRRKKK